MKHFFIAFLISLALIAKAQSSHTVFTRNMVWPGLLGEYKFNDKWSLWLDAQFRYEYTDGDVFQWCARPSVTYKLNTGLLLSLGGAYFSLYPNPNGRTPRPELRPWQEVGYKFKLNAHHTLYPRARFEQRFIREYAGTELADEFSFNSFRLRLRVDYTYAFGNAEKPSPWFLLAGNELFLLQKTDGFSAYDQNRTWAGFGYKINANHNLQLFYLHLRQQRNSAVTDQFHVMRLVYQFAFASKPKVETK